MHPKRLLQILKDSVNKFTDSNIRDCMNTIVDFNDNKNLIVPVENNKIRIIDMDSILYVKEPKKGNVYIITQDEEIEFKCSSYDLLEYLDEKCNQFTYLNNGLVVNINKVAKYQEYYRKLYFFNGECVEITGSAMKYITKYVLSKECAIDQDTFSGNFEPFRT